MAEVRGSAQDAERMHEHTRHLVDAFVLMQLGGYKHGINTQRMELCKQTSMEA